MHNRFEGTAMLAALFTVLAVVPLAADDSQFTGRIRQRVPFTAKGDSQERERASSDAQQMSWLRPLSGQTADWISTNALLMSAGDTRTETAPPQVAAHQQGADGTWREDGQFIIINLNGQEFKLVKTSPVHDPDRRQQVGVSPVEHLRDVADRRAASGGTVSGRLLHRRRPLVNCKVSLVPLQKGGFGSYKVNAAGQPQSATTDEQGNYRFEDVPAGPYKLFWLPRGQNQWIRRIEFRPDVVVRDDETSHIKDIRISLTTVN